MTEEQAGGSGAVDPLWLGYAEYPAELRAVLGARYCTACVVIRPGWTTDDEALLLQADEPFTAEVVARLLVERGYEAPVVRRLGRGSGFRARRGTEWVAEVAGAWPASRPFAYLGVVGRDYADVRNIVRYGLREHLEYVGYDWRAGRWAAMPGVGTARYEDDNGEKFVEVTKEQAERLARGFGRELPSDEELNEVLRDDDEVARARAARWNRFYDERAARFAGEIAAVRAEAARLADQPPPFERVDMVADRQRLVRERPAEPARLGEAFPLARFLIGHFRPAGAVVSTGRADVTCNRIALTTPDGATFDCVVNVHVQGGVLARRLSATPFSPEEGYQVDEADYDLDARHAKLIALGHSPSEDPVSHRVFPVSPALLTVDVEVHPDRDRDALSRISLALDFPGDRRYTGLGGWDGGRLRFRQWVPGDRGALASSGWVRPGLYLWVPDDPHLLKPVRASFVPKPDSRERYREADYPAPIFGRYGWPDVVVEQGPDGVRFKHRFT